MPRISQSVAMGVGVAGALVDVTSDVNLDEGVSRSWGQDDEFRDTAPGTFSFTLDNGTGKYTPGNTAGGLSTLVTEGMQVCWQLGTRLVAGTIRGIEPVFPSDESAWAQIRITCDDLLGNLARSQISTTIAQAMVRASSPYLYWPFNEPAGASVALEQSGNQQLPLDPSFAAFGGVTGVPTFGVAGISYLGETQATFPNNGAGTESGLLPGNGGVTGGFSTINYATGSMGTWGAWFTLNEAPNGTTGLLVFVRPNGYPGLTSSSFRFGLDANGRPILTMGTNQVLSTLTVAVGAPHYLQMVLTNSGSASITAELFVDGVSQGACVYGPAGADPAGLSSNFLRTPMFVGIVPAVGLSPSTSVAHLSHTPLPVPEYVLSPGTEAGLITAAAAAGGVALGTLPTNLSTATVSFNSLSGSSALDAFNAVIKTEQGYLYTSTTGTLTSPTQVVKIRERTRNPSVDYTFDTILDLDGAIPYVRDVTNMVSTLTVAGPSLTLVLQDATVTPRVGPSSTSESILNNSSVDILAWGQDRLNRGKNAALRVSNVTVDAMTTTTDRSTALLAMIPGDHIQTTSNPTTQLGFAAWDGLLIGADEHHSTTEHTFAMRLAPVQAATGIYDTDLYANGGNNTISTALTNVATSMLCTSADVITLFETSAMNYYLIVDSEVVKVTACTAPVAGVQTLTITRAQFGTTAAAHSVGAVPEVYADSTGRLNNGIYAF